MDIVSTPTRPSLILAAFDPSPMKPVVLTPAEGAENASPHVIALAGGAVTGGEAHSGEFFWRRLEPLLCLLVV